MGNKRMGLRKNELSPVPNTMLKALVKSQQSLITQNYLKVF